MSGLLRALLFLPLLLLSPLLSRGGGFEHTVTEELSGELSPGAALLIENVNGKIVLQSGTTDRYHIQITKKSRAKENLELIEVRREIAHDRIKLAVHLPKKQGWFSRQQIQGSVEIVVTAPTTVDLADIRTVNGTVAINGFSHYLKAASTNGTIDAQDLRGSAELDTVNGSIRASFLNLTPLDHLTCSSVNGGIDLRFPENLDADLQTSVVNGRIHCDFPLTLTDGASSRRLQGRIGDGGAALKATTVNGTIRIRNN